MQRLVASAALVTNVACDHACGSGYAVVDPMPTPGRVTGVAASMAATVSYADGGTRFILEVTDPAMIGATLVAKRTGIEAGVGYTLGGGKIISATTTPTGMRFELEPLPGFGSIYVQIDVDGVDAGHGVEARILFFSSEDGGRSVIVNLVDL